MQVSEDQESPHIVEELTSQTMFGWDFSNSDDFQQWCKSNVHSVEIALQVWIWFVLATTASPLWEGALPGRGWWPHCFYIYDKADI